MSRSEYAKSPLMVITVAYSDLPIVDSVGPFAFAVILGDCVLPGHIIGRYMSEEEADEACVNFADHYRLRRHPHKQPWRFAPVLTLIEGGLSTPPSSEEPCGARGHPARDHQAVPVRGNALP